MCQIFRAQPQSPLNLQHLLVSTRRQAVFLMWCFNGKLSSYKSGTLDNIAGVLISCPNLPKSTVKSNDLVSEHSFSPTLQRFSSEPSHLPTP